MLIVAFASYGIEGDRLKTGVLIEMIIFKKRFVETRTKLLKKMKQIAIAWVERYSPRELLNSCMMRLLKFSGIEF